MQRFLFSKVELWLVGLLAALGLVGTVLFGAVVKNATEAGLRTDVRPKYGRIGDLALDLAATPETARLLLTERRPLLAERTARFAGKPGGWTVPAGAGHLSGYLLLSRVDGDIDRSVVELVDLADYSVKYRWTPDAEALLAGAARTSTRIDFTHWQNARFRVAHPYLMDDGGLLVRNHDSPLVRVDHCSRKLWMQDATIFHHSTNPGPDGNFWIPSHIEPSDVAMADDYLDDAITEVSPEGRILYRKSVSRILLEHGYMPLLFGDGVYSRDPIHLNDIQPVLADGPYWKRGDLFLSLRNRSLLLLYRPSTDRIVWMKQGPWMAQHDVDIIDDHTIGVFNNNTYNSGAGAYILGNSDVLYYDFATGETRHPLGDQAVRNDILSITEGLFEVTGDGGMIVEEEMSGRILLFDAGARLIAEYLNRAKDGAISLMGWSRYIPRARGDAVLAVLAGAGPCP
jgi:Arylsulfotransferase (ASST)